MSLVPAEASVQAGVDMHGAQDVLTFVAFQRLRYERSPKRDQGVPLRSFAGHCAASVLLGYVRGDLGRNRCNDISRSSSLDLIGMGKSPEFMRVARCICV